MEELQGAEETDRRAKEKAIKSAAAEAAAEKRKATLARVERMKDWDDEEVRMLEKALDKFPQVGVPLPLPLLRSAPKQTAEVLHYGPLTPQRYTDSLLPGVLGSSQGLLRLLYHLQKLPRSYGNLAVPDQQPVLLEC